MVEDNRRQDELIEELNKRMMDRDVADDDAVINGGRKTFSLHLCISPVRFTNKCGRSVVNDHTHTHTHTHTHRHNFTEYMI